MTETLHPSHLELTEQPAVADSKLLDGMTIEDGSYYPGKYTSEELEWLATRAREREPDLWKWLQESGTDGLHGTQSSSLRSICEHGILPQEELSRVPFPVTSVEFMSLPEPRPTVHMVHWLFAEKITRYAESSEHHLTPDNYQDAIYPDETLRSWEGSPLAHFTHLRNRHLTALALRDYLRSPDADQAHIDMLTKNFPVVFGIRSGQLTQDGLFSVETGIKGDVAYKGSVEPSAITSVFAPRAEIERVQKITDKPVFALEDLRTMTNNLV